MNQCNRRLAEHELVVGLLYLNTYHFSGAERRLKMMLEQYADYADLERAYYYLAEALRQKAPTALEIEAYQKNNSMPWVRIFGAMYLKLIKRSL